MSAALLATGSELLYREALLLDRKDWDAWLALYTEDSLFWLPAWKSVTEVTDDPATQVSLIYYPSRAGLEERVWRIRSGTSIASTPMPRTVHQLGNVLLLGSDGSSSMTLSSAWTTHSYRTKRREVQQFFGHYEHDLVLVDGQWKIARKKVILANDYIQTVLDIYSV